MYLSLLNEEEKKLFCGLAYNIVMADGIFQDKERKLLESYEMELGFPVELDKIDEDFDIILDKLDEEATQRSKKIIVFECIGLAVIDSEYAQQEREMIHKIILRFNIDGSFERECESILYDYLKLQNRLNEVVLNI